MHSLKAFRYPTVVIAALTLALALAGCGSSGGSSSAGDSQSNGSKGPIIFGAAIALTGVNAPYDKPAYQALELAVKNLNAEGGIEGRKIKFITEDMQSDTSKGTTTAKDVISKGADLLLVPCDPDLAAPGAIVGSQEKVLTISLCEASSRLGPKTVGPYFFTPAQTVFLEGYDMAEWAYMHKHLNSAFLLVDKSFTYTLNACKGFENRWKSLGGTVSGVSKVADTDTSIAPTVAQIKKSNPDVVYLCTQTPGGPTFLRQIRAAGLDMPLMSDMAMDGTYWLKSVPNLSNFYYPSITSNYGDDPSSVINSLRKQFIDNYSKPPITAYAYYGPMILDIYSAAVKKADSFDSTKLVKALETIPKIHTDIGDIRYTKDAHILLTAPMRIMQIQKGKPSYLTTWTVREAPSLNG